MTDGDEDLEKFGDDLILEECWTWKEPEEVDCWSITLTPCSDLLSFKTKFRNCQETLPISLYEIVTEFKNGLDNVFIVSCKTIDLDQKEEYVFLYIIPSKEIVYSVSMTCRSLENTNYKGVYSNLISHMDDKRWVSKDGGPLSHSVLWSRLN